MRPALPAGVALAGALAAGVALAGAPEPAKPVDPATFSGRWFQLGRWGADSPRPCPAATEDFTAGPKGTAVTVSCHPAGGGGAVYHGRLAILPGSANAKFRLRFFGGLITREYWTLDHAGDWAVTMTPNGRTLYLMARRPALDAAEKAVALAKVRALGFEPGAVQP